MIPICPQYLLCVLDSYTRFLGCNIHQDYVCSLNWQHQLCKNPRPNPDIKTLFTDHTCVPTNGVRPSPPVNGPLVGPPIPKSGPFPQLGVHSVRNSNCLYKFKPAHFLPVAKNYNCFSDAAIPTCCLSIHKCNCRVDDCC